MARVRVLASFLLALVITTATLATTAAADPEWDPPDSPGCVLVGQCEGAGFGFPPNPPPQDYGAGSQGATELIKDAAIGIANAIGDAFNDLGTFVHDTLDWMNQDIYWHQEPDPCWSAWCDM